MVKPEERVKQLEFAVEKLSDKVSLNSEPDFKFSDLTEWFSEKQIEWRIQSSGEYNGKTWALIVPYIDSRMVQDRLDKVCGPQYWQDHYEQTENGFICNIMIKFNGEWISKSDGAAPTEIEGFKGGISDAFKRAAVKWGIGRYLYSFPKTYAEVSEKILSPKDAREFGWESAKIKFKDGTEKWINWKAPQLTHK